MRGCWRVLAGKRYTLFAFLCYSSKLHACLSHFLLDIPTWMCHRQVKLNQFKGNFSTSYQIFSSWLFYSRIQYFLFPKCSCHNALFHLLSIFNPFPPYFVNTASKTDFEDARFSSPPLLSLLVQVTKFPHLDPCNSFYSSHIPRLPPPIHSFHYSKNNISKTKVSSCSS